MDINTIRARLSGRYPQGLTTIDSHTAGEPTRLIVAGLPDIPGATMAGKRSYFMEHLDHVRLLLTREPRGHRDMLAAAVTAPCSPDADFGLVYMDARRYPFLCGHATIGAVTTLIECGVLKPSGDEMQVLVDTPSGPMHTLARLVNGKVASVTFQSVPSFVAARDRSLQVAELGRVSVDLVCVGGFFVMVDAQKAGLHIVPEEGPKLIDMGMRIIEAANSQLEVRHPLRPEVKSIDVAEIHDTRDGEGLSAVVYGASHLDRSPCGTGTTAKITLLHAKGELGKGETFLNRSMLGAAFSGMIVDTPNVGEYPGVVVAIEGTAHMTGMHFFCSDSTDPYPQGFLL